jgi:hypothetical protein
VFSADTLTGDFVRYGEAVAASVHVSELNAACPEKAVRASSMPPPSTMAATLPRSCRCHRRSYPNIGANHVLLVLPQLAQFGTGQTWAEKVLKPVVQAYGSNLAQILIGIRGLYQGTLIVMMYYSPSPALDGVTAAVNGVMSQVAAQISMTPGFAPITGADGFTAIPAVSLPRRAP